jgi:hypothetical protein
MRRRRLLAFLSISVHPQVLLPTLLTTHAVSWPVVLNSRGSLRPDTPFFLFEAKVSHQLGIKVGTAALLCIPVTGFALLCWLIQPLVGRWRARGRRPAGLCSRCGYDLRASPGRCPECVAVPTRMPYKAAPPPTSLHP